MKSRALGIAFFVLACVPDLADAQCATLGTPGQTGCGLGANSAPAIACLGSPTLGNAAFGVTGTVTCVPSFPFLLVGSCASPPVPIPGPFGTDGFCGPSAGGCLAFVGPTFFFAVPGAISSTGFFFPLPIPNDPTLLGATACAQEVHLCILFVGSCLAVSNGISVTIT